MARAGALNFPRVALGAALLLVPTAAIAQRGGSGVELRLDAVVAESANAVHAGAGAITRLGRYARLVAIAGAGPGDRSARARAELAVRFHTDPFRERTLGVYGAEGAGVMFGERGEPFILAVIGAERARKGGAWAPSFEAGFGRGLRIAFVLRRVPGNSR